MLIKPCALFPAARLRACLALVLAVFLGCAAQAQSPTGAQAAPALANNTVLIVRHAEKPTLGSGLTKRGEARAEAYVHYFEPFHEGPETFRVDALYSGADSPNSLRPRLTLEPLSHATGLPLDSSVSTKEPEVLVHMLAATPHPAHPLIAWRHGAIPALLKAFGADPATLLPNGTWPDEVYDWVFVLHFDATGHLLSAHRYTESLSLPN